MRACISTVQLLVRASQQTLLQPRSQHWTSATTASFLLLLALAYYPERLISRLPTHILTVVAGAIMLFAPMRPLLVALVPNPVDEAHTEKRPVRSKFSATGRRWTLVVVVGTLVGAFAFLGEISEGGSASSMARLVFVASVFIGLGLAGILIAYAYLAKPLGLGPLAKQIVTEDRPNLWHRPPPKPLESVEVSTGSVSWR